MTKYQVFAYWFLIGIAIGMIGVLFTQIDWQRTMDLCAGYYR